ncbi:C2H2 type zinc-finger-domain-containing protein [Gamsiella multidivaricata]|uniref:C2H2 type zinc-finger-domain-containing protein n=1 Tax=Gamsiella multidivaricata TaxID=101098 RepID=UPI00221EED01|nr:C2H2 type zinc-finger-domain-containing protein [Gamsiella multidivaricata]KAG0370138.1 hypothetical protein BGZ54_007568 [Gamsiella multidivaricata]KAI7817183.1 C2H2 type zinc-finger-domain-containing protein [Gamsiella multidivaricata]
MSYAVNAPVATIGQSTTCLACGIRLPSLETQQMHHKSDWHTYNLKRKMVNLPPVSSEVFAQLVTATREQANPEEAPQPECVPCGKKYLSFQAYDNHLNSKKHKQTVVTYEKKQQKEQKQQKQQGQEQEQAQELSSSEDDTSATKYTAATAPEQLEPSETVCLFCSHRAENATLNYEHMRSTHGFFLPSFERLIDLPGILTYLAEKLLENLDCFWCTPSVFSQNLRPDQELHASFASLTAVRRHMNDKGHCKLAMDHGAEREYADFYLPLADYGTDYDDDDETLKDSLADDSTTQTAGETLDEDQKRLNLILLDEHGNWILDDGSPVTSGIHIDPATNELVLNNRRLAHKDAARRQKVESRTVTLTSRSNRRPTTDVNADANTDESAADEEDQDKDTALTNDPHHPDARISNALLKSQNQLSGSTMAVSTVQMHQLAVKISKAQNVESDKRAKMAMKMGLGHNSSARLRCNVVFGTKV